MPGKNFGRAGRVAVQMKNDRVGWPGLPCGKCFCLVKIEPGGERGAQSKRAANTAIKRKNSPQAVYRLRRAGAEGGNCTLATVSRPTPLAGEPLRPLGYFCVPNDLSDSLCSTGRKIWRREWDSNPRLLRVTGFQDRLLKPLGHLSTTRAPPLQSNACIILPQACRIVNTRNRKTGAKRPRSGIS